MSDAVEPKQVSVILPVHNADKWLDECLESVLQQAFGGSLELSVYDDASTDQSGVMLKQWSNKLMNADVSVVIGSNKSGQPCGVGFAKNQAVQQSSGKYLCFLDADDVMHPLRIQKQYDAGKTTNDTIIGCKFHRTPEGSTPRYTEWANNLDHSQLYTQIYTAFGPTIVMPTWFCHRDVYYKVGGFSESGKGTPEDLLFFYSHLQLGGKLYRVDEDLLLYRYHPSATTFSILEDTIWNIRLKELEQNVLARWSAFTIWNAGKQGRKFFRTLNPENQEKVQAFCDVDEKKLTKGMYIYEETEQQPKPRIPIVHFSVACAPFIICVKLQMTGGDFEKNLSSLNLKEGVDYFHFS